MADARIATFGQQRVLVVERFDRRIAPDGRWLMRLPQEDFCQVEGCSPPRKYESDGGPGLMALFGRTPAAIAKVQAELPADFSPHVAETILGGFERAADALAAMVS